MMLSPRARFSVCVLTLLASGAGACASATQKGGGGAGGGGAGTGGTDAGVSAVGGRGGAGGVGGMGGLGAAGGAAGSGNSGADAGAGSGGAGGGVGPSPCAARAGLSFCDDFEAAPVAAPPIGRGWAASISGAPGTIAIDGATPAHSGTRSVRVSPGAGDFDTFFVFHDATVLPAPAGRFFLRLYMRIAQPMTPMHNTFFIADLFATPGGGNAVRVGEDIGMLMMTVGGDAHGYLSNQSYYNDGLPGIVFVPGAWTCVEIAFDPALTTMDVWVDGQEIPDMHPTNIQQDSYDTLRFGFEKYAGPVSDLWYDDIAIGTERIGCN